MKRIFLTFATTAFTLTSTLPATAGEKWLLPEAQKPITAETAPTWATDHPDLILDLQSLRSAYPSQFTAVEKRPKAIFLHLANGTEVLYDDGIPKSPEQAIEGEADVQDSLSQIYPLTPVEKRIAPSADPGRARSEPLFHSLFGTDKAAVETTAKTINFCGRRIQFSGRQNAADQLAKVAAALDAEIKKDPALRPYVESLGGTLNWRFIAGTKRLSAHAWGTAIDLNPDLGAYWKWTPKENLATYPRTRFHQIIVETFESHGFIWGGKWYHLDLMHFEYRPELIEKAKRSPLSE